MKSEGVSEMRVTRFAHIVITLQILVRVWGHKWKIEGCYDENCVFYLCVKYIDQ